MLSFLMIPNIPTLTVSAVIRDGLVGMHIKSQPACHHHPPWFHFHIETANHLSRVGQLLYSPTAKRAEKRQRTKDPDMVCLWRATTVLVGTSSPLVILGESGCFGWGVGCGVDQMWQWSPTWVERPRRGNCPLTSDEHNKEESTRTGQISVDPNTFLEATLTPLVETHREPDQFVTSDEHNKGESTRTGQMSVDPNAFLEATLRPTENQIRQFWIHRYWGYL